MSRNSLQPSVGFLSPPPDARALGDNAFGFLVHGRQLLPCTRRDTPPKEKEHRIERLRGGRGERRSDHRRAWAYVG
eukprot:scaffold7684_cov119-Isochrysis_galbana.AAC.17